ncbi:MAG: inositol 2-dehydrogenase [Pseudomonadota bacterium]
MADKLLNLAVLGVGRIGRVHALTISKNKAARLAAVADAMPKAANEVADQYDCPVQSIDEIACRADIDGVVICTPTDTHADLIEQFARAGKAIFCEKPIDLSVDRVRTCLAVVEECPVPLMLGFNRRFDAEMATLRQTAQSGAIGDVELVQITSRDPAPPPIGYIKVSGGIFRDMMIHDFDMARFILGEDPVSVSAQGSVLVDPEIGTAGDFDTATAILKTSSGKQAIITNSRRASYGYDQRVEVHGSKGMAQITNHRETSVEVATGEGFKREPLKAFFMERYMRAYESELDAFIETVKGGSAPDPAGIDGLKALIIADGATLSAQKGGLVKLQF